MNYSSQVNSLAIKIKSEGHQFTKKIRKNAPASLRAEVIDFTGIQFDNILLILNEIPKRIIVKTTMFYSKPCETEKTIIDTHFFDKFKLILSPFGWDNVKLDTQ